ncbi:hypothetical protein SAMN00017477_0898 [Peptoniphilus asaccharolyticus DSM 20463]|uniref:Uncharacterized protein n=1 Tax=Peptoniphilus asaccharolyticus DSM 20463 TaxID=573058 RepID=A0A1W1UZF3_PEPAS|nr:hypothetical protein [Peptoniphilus asaccharolyticus]MBL7575392.1 hypothetical protein [Peptoniphilus asaccharolyticus]SMB86446.1 hypothetical protein SAMN00017477_0898 [Peptoniphilus asaccharolyticus DSM 20463]
MTKKTPMYNVTFKDIENYIQKGYEKGRKETIERASQLSMAVPIMVLRDEFGFGEKRIDKFIVAYIELYNSISEGYLDLNDIIKTINEETGVKIVERNR